MLDLLAAQSERKVSGRASYRALMEKFEERPQALLGTRNPLVNLARQFRKGYLKWRGRRELLGIERKGGG